MWFPQHTVRSDNAGEVSDLGMGSGAPWAPLRGPQFNGGPPVQWHNYETKFLVAFFSDRTDNERQFHVYTN